MSGIFSEKIGVGGGDGNKTKSITSRSGNAVTMNDDAGSVLINDKYGSDGKIKLDGKGNIGTSAKSSVNTVVAGSKEAPDGNSSLKMDKDGNINLKANTEINLNVGESTWISMSNGNITIHADGISIIGKKIFICGTEDTYIKGKASQIKESGDGISIDGKPVVTITGSEVKIN
jgi:hypothetical protein